MHLCLITGVYANAEIRDWKLKDGTELRGEIDDVDETAETVTLKGDQGKVVVVPLDSLSALDRAWVLQWIEFAEELGDAAEKFGGRIEHYEGKGETTTTPFHVYHPSGDIPVGTARPMMILFSANGKGIRFLLRHIKAAEEVKMTLVACDVFRNHMEERDSIRRFRELLPIIRATVPHDPERDFMGGSSGGAWRSFNLSSDLPDETWTGVYSNGGWLGGEKNWNRDYPAMRVAMVNGDEDKAANAWLDRDIEILQEHDCTVAVVAFEGGHQVPPPSVQVKAFKWLLGEIE
ncbi:hypothetical protein [Haloferula sp.]|uniref:hypothetical protein n=1 Tax=Haloferula sp. TaxID=2497595 RepID=UPI003C78E14B